VALPNDDGPRKATFARDVEPRLNKVFRKDKLVQRRVRRVRRARRFELMEVESMMNVEVSAFKFSF
jgi:hypothetical protein